MDRSGAYDLLLVIHSNRGPVLYRLHIGRKLTVGEEQELAVQ